MIAAWAQGVGGEIPQGDDCQRATGQREGGLCVPGGPVQGSVWRARGTKPATNGKYKPISDPIGIFWKDANVIKCCLIHPVFINGYWKQ